MANIYLTKDLRQVFERRTLQVRLPYGLNTDRWAVRMVTLWLRAFLRVIFVKMQTELAPQLNQLIEMYFDKGLMGPGPDIYVSPGGRIFRNGEKGYWVPQHGHAPFGVCPVCMTLEEKYRNGGPPQQMFAEMMSAAHAIIHVDSAVKRPVCYCQIMPYKEANNYGVYGTQDSDDVDEFPPELWDLILNRVQEWIAIELSQSIQDAMQQLNMEVQAAQAKAAKQNAG